MWNAFSNIAEKAKAAAQDLEGQLNESVGVVETSKPSSPKVVDDSALNDAWADDFDISTDPSPEKTPPAASLPVTATNTAAITEEGDGWQDDGLDFDAEEETTPNNHKEETKDVPEEKESVAIAALSSETALTTEPTNENLKQTSTTEESIVNHSTEEVPEEESAWQQDDLDLDNTDTQNVDAEEEVHVVPMTETTSTTTTSVVQPDVEAAAAEEDPDTLSDEPQPQEESSTNTTTLENNIEKSGQNESVPPDPSVSVIVDTDIPNDGPSTDALTEDAVVPKEEEAQMINQTKEQPLRVEERTLIADATQQDSKNILSEQQAAAVSQLEEQVAKLKHQVNQREEQLIQKTEQITTMQNLADAEKEELIRKIESTKDEAKRRIQKAKERVEATEAQLQAVTASQGGTAEQVSKQAEIIAELRNEGEKLAHRQSEMEQAVRSAKGESRELSDQLEAEQNAKDKALGKIQTLQEELTSTKAQLSAARKGESQASRLESELQSAREEMERKSSAILSLEQQVKELKAEGRHLTTELDAAKKGAVLDTEREQKKLRKEHDNSLADMEQKLRTIEREAALREDALRHEVEELRKRWQDAVRRADSLSMDVQSSSAPLLRQLESMERQGRARASAWAELETKLRSELEENIVSVEQLTKERTDWKTKFTRLERTSKEDTEELKRLRIDVEDKTIGISKLEDKLSQLGIEGNKKQEEWAEIERLANEGVARVRSEMAQTVVEAEERYRSQMDSLEADLRQERNKRDQLEKQIQDLLDNSYVPTATATISTAPIETKPKKLLKTQRQSEILEGALNGLGDEDEEVEDWEGDDNVEEEAQGSFAAMEQVNSRLKVANAELEALRKSLKESEKSRDTLIEELGEARVAKDKLPLFEAKVQELTVENQQQALEIEALQEDISDVRQLYRSQLNALLEEKTAPPTEGENISNGTNGSVDESHAPSEATVTKLPVDDDEEW